MRIRRLLIPAALCAVAAACINDDAITGGNECEEPRVTTTMRGDTVVSSTGLRYINTVVGTGNTARVCRRAEVAYVLRLESGAVADSSNTGRPIAFSPLVDAVIPGFAEGVVGLRAGGSRRLIVPPQLGYGGESRPSRGAGFAAIPANSTLIFDITLVSAAE